MVGFREKDFVEMEGGLGIGDGIMVEERGGQSDSDMIYVCTPSPR